MFYCNLGVDYCIQPLSSLISLRMTISVWHNFTGTPSPVTAVMRLECNKLLLVVYVFHFEIGGKQASKFGQSHFKIHFSFSIHFFP